jgi:16S rRNA (uracil1498-N3)-methyltransferase
MHVFHSPVIDQGMTRLGEEESRHCVRVLRLRAGEEVIVTDGRGMWCRAVLADPNPRACLLQVVSCEEKFRQRPVSLHMAVAPTRQIDRFEWFLEKATECGVDEVTPLYCEHSERQWVRPERLERVMLSAMKQSLRAFLPRLNPGMSFRDFVGQPFEGARLIAHCGEGEKTGLQAAFEPGRNARVLVGPEGDFSAGEVEEALQAGYVPVSLGRHRLRTETAAITLCIGFNMMNRLI